MRNLNSVVIASSILLSISSVFSISCLEYISFILPALVIDTHSTLFYIVTSLLFNITL